jgi:hypothetical protein
MAQSLEVGQEQSPRLTLEQLKIIDYYL